MTLFELFDRVYIKVGKDFYERNLGLNFLELVDEVASHVKQYDGILLIDTINNKKVIYQGRTKAYIVKMANRFIADFVEVPSDENMASFVSRRQINKLVRVFNGDHGSVSCYVLIILYVMFSCIIDNPNGTSVKKDLFKSFLEAARDLVNAYSAEYGEDVLAHFINECYDTVENAIETETANKRPGDFPGVPKKKPANSHIE